MLTSHQIDTLNTALNSFHIELPSWGFANTGTRFGKFLQPAAATTTEEKFGDAGQVHRWTGCLPHASRCTSCGIFPTALTTWLEVADPGREARAAGRLHQSQRIPGPDL